MSSALATLRARLELSLDARLSSTLLLRERAAPVTVSSGVAALDQLSGGLPRGALSEIVGAASSGRTSVMLAALARATHRQEICALVDASDSFDPASAAIAGVYLDRLLWVRCSDQSSPPRRNVAASKTPGHRLEASTEFMSGGRLEQVLKVADLLLQSGGFGMVVLDLGDISPKSARRIPLTSWFRFRRAVEPTATVLLLIEQQPSATTCASLVIRLEQNAFCARDTISTSERPIEAQPGLSQTPGNLVSHASLMRKIDFRAEVTRSWMQRKFSQSAGIHFELHATS